MVMTILRTAGYHACERSPEGAAVACVRVGAALRTEVRRARTSPLVRPAAAFAGIRTWPPLTRRSGPCEEGRVPIEMRSGTAALRAGDPIPAEPPRTLVANWAAAIGALALAKLLSLSDPTGLLGANLAGVAAFLFIALPDRRLRARGEGWDRYGLPWWGLADGRTWRAWGRAAAVALLVCAVVFPAFGAGFWAYAEALPRLPAWAAHALAPYATPPHPRFRLPEGLATAALVQLLVVALPEELFYRGWMQTSWARAAPAGGVRLLGVRLGPGFLWTQALFAAGHLVVLQPWRLGTFFPGLLFGWLRERTGSIAVPVLVHALSNLFIATLERSFYG
jgi:CAAX protease family protein